MQMILAVLVVVWLSVPVAKASDDNSSGPDTPVEKDARLAKVRDAKTSKVGILTYYPNKAGGLTFLEEDKILFFTLPYEPTTRQVENMVLPAIGTVPLAGQTVYRSQVFQNGFGSPHRADTAIAKWTRAKPGGKFNLAIMAEDSETRMKVKSIVPVLEHAERGR